MKFKIIMILVLAIVVVSTETTHAQLRFGKAIWEAAKRTKHRVAPKVVKRLPIPKPKVRTRVAQPRLRAPNITARQKVVKKLQADYALSRLNMKGIDPKSIRITNNLPVDKKRAELIGIRTIKETEKKKHLLAQRQKQEFFNKQKRLKAKFNIEARTTKELMLKRQAVSAKIKEKRIKKPKGWIRSFTAKGSKPTAGIKFVDPKDKGNSVRIMHKNSKSSFKAQRKDYIQYAVKGTHYDVKGRPLKSSKVEEAHIPLDEFNIEVMPKHE